MKLYMTGKLRRLGFSFVSVAVLVALWATMFLPTARAQNECTCQGTAELEQKIENQVLQQLPQEIVKVLLQQNLLNHQIARGIEEYIKKQQQAQALSQEKQEQLASEKAAHVRRVSGSRDHIYCNPDAPISLIEYSDFECPFCKRFQATAKEVVESSAGKVNWVYRYFPLEAHNPGAQKEAEASECASYLGGNNAFWKYADTIYARTRSNGNGFPLTQLALLAKEIGLNKKKFSKCVESDEFAPRVQEDVDEARKIGISATPTTILLDNETGEVTLRSGALPPEVLKVDIEKLLETNSLLKSSAVR
jgi:protein-disulfide isomerase